MNNTNRALNRLVIGIIGIVVCTLGAAVAAAALQPAWLAAWRSAATDTATAIEAFRARTLFGDGDRSWILLVVVAGAALGIIVLLAFILRQGRGHASTLLTTGNRDAAGGSLSVASAVAERALSDALTTDPGLASSAVSTFRVRKTATIKIVVSARRGESPGDIRERIDRLVARWDDAFGERGPVFIRVTGGFAARVRKPVRVREDTARPG